MSPQALVSFDGNYYSVPPGHRDQQVTVCRPLGSATIDIFSTAGNTLARHRLQPRGAHVIARLDEHVAALEKAVLTSAGDTAAPCRRKKRIPPSARALAEADQIRATLTGRPLPAGQAPVVDFATYASASRPLGPAGAPAADQAAGDS